MAVMESGQMNSMRQNAGRRSNEMHKRSVVSASHYSQGSENRGDIPPQENTAENEKKTDIPNKIKPVKKKDPQLSDMINKIFQGKLDGDKLLIIMLMMMLMKEGADLKLIIALGYILL